MENNNHSNLHNLEYVDLGYLLFHESLSLLHMISFQRRGLFQSPVKQLK